MSKKLEDFMKLLRSEKDTRDDSYMGTFVPWLRKRTPILRNLDTRHVIEVIRNAKYSTYDKDAVIFRQGKPRDREVPLHVYILLGGSASLYNDPFMTQGKSSRRSSFSVERLLLSSVMEKSRLHPLSAKSGHSKSTGSRLSPIIHASVTEELDDDVDQNFSDVEDDAIEEVAEANLTRDNTVDLAKDDTESVIKVPYESGDKDARSSTPGSKISKRSKVSVRTKLGNFVVKYEKGKYISEEGILNDDDIYTGSIIVDDLINLIVIDEHTFDEYIKEHHEKEAVDLTDYVEYHPFFRELPIHSKGLIQISLKKHHVDAGKFIVKQGEQVKSVKFIISGSADVIVEPAKHRYQYPQYWPFETSTDVYYKECDWLRESRRRTYEQKHIHHGEVTKRRHFKFTGSHKEVSVCAVLDREAIGVTEMMLNLNTYVQSYRCVQDCEVYSLSLKPFRRIQRRSAELTDLLWAYIRMKLQFRISNSLGEKVPLFYCLYDKLKTETREKSYNGMVTKSIEKIKARESELEQALEWFKLDKAPLINNKDPNITQMKESMKERARIRQSVFQHDHVKPYFRRGCMRAVKPTREPLSLHKLKNPVNELILRLNMEGADIQTEQDLDEILRAYTETPIDRSEDVSRQLQRVIDEQYNIFRYRRYGNQLVRKFERMLVHGKMTRDRTIMSSALFSDARSSVDLVQSDIRRVEEASNDEFERALSRFTKRTTRSYASTYRTLQFDRRSVTPGTIEMRVRDFHQRCGGQTPEINGLPELARFDEDQVEPDDAPLPGGKVFVTKIPCVSCNKNIHLKNHNHKRCQMLHELPMDKVRGYKPIK